MFAFYRDPTAFLDALPYLFLFILAIGAGVAALYFLRIFLKNWQPAEPDDEKSLLSQFGELHRSGELSPEEFRSVRVSLAHQMEERAEQAEARRREKERR